MTNEYLPVEAAIERINRFPVKGEPIWNREEIIEWIGQALHKIHGENQLVEMTIIIEIEDGTAKLPHHHNIIEILEYDHNYHMVDVGSSGMLREDLTYKIQQGRIFTCFDTGKICMRYRAHALDERGYPLIPDTEEYLSAVEAYGLERIGRKLFMLGELDAGRYKLLQDERSYYLKAAQVASRALSNDRLANLQKGIYKPYMDVRRKTPRKWR